MLRLLCRLAPLILAAAAPAWSASPVVLFDQGHGQRFVIEKTDELDLSQLAEVFRRAGYEVRSTQGKITAEALRGVDVLITSGLFQPYMEAELKDILSFVEQGGGLAAMLHIAPTYGNLLQALGVMASPGVLYEGENVIGDRAIDFQVVNLADHPLVAGVTQFSAYGAWAVMDGGRDPEVKTVAFTSRSSWIDMDGNRERSPKEVLHSFGVAVAGKRGKGHFAVFGDDAIFQNRFLDAANSKLAENLAAWLWPAM